MLSGRSKRPRDDGSHEKEAKDILSNSFNYNRIAHTSHFEMSGTVELH